MLAIVRFRRGQKGNLIVDFGKKIGLSEKSDPKKALVREGEQWLVEIRRANGKIIFLRLIGKVEELSYCRSHQPHTRRPRKTH